VSAEERGVNVWFAGGGTGGHLYPALAIARAMVRADARVRPFFIGARRGIERDVLPTTEFPFELLDLHPLYRAAPWQNWRTLVGGVSAWRRVSAIARAAPPAAVVATGGYVAGVALQFARARGVPYVLQEQNSFPGATVRWFARGARQIHVGFPEAAALLRVTSRTEVFDSGNPIEPPPEPRPLRAAADAVWAWAADAAPTVLVFGGSQGAEAINRVVAAWLERGSDTARRVRLIWSTGRGPYEGYARFASDRVRVRPYIAPMTDAYAAADVAIGRAGAMATAELAAWGLPMVLVPLPTAAADHQSANARTLAEAGAALLVPQSGFTPETLDATLRTLLDDPAMLDRMRRAARERARPAAAADIAAHILTLPTLQ